MRIGDYLRLRFVLLFAAWMAISQYWLPWAALPFQLAVGGLALFYVVRRERVVGALKYERSQVAEVEHQLSEAEERYQALVETLPLATYIDRAGGGPGVAWVSPQIEKITSYTPAEWLADPYLFAKLLHHDDRSRVLAELKRAKAAGEEVDHEYRFVRRDGSIVWVHDTGVTIEDEDGTRFTRGFIVDVTARRDAELELESQNERLRELDRLKDEFVALVSHELRTPLTSIRGYLELMAEDTDTNEEQARFLETINRNAQRLERVVGDLLFVAQVEAGHLSLEDGVVDVNAVVRNAVEAGKPVAQRKSIELVANLTELGEIAGDRARLEQVLDNFVSNAIKFTPIGGRIEVMTRTSIDELEISVTDTGMGISADELPHLFERFFRTERATASAIPGTGLGLAIARAIVEGHGGRIVVTSVEGTGTTFRICLPR